jgi:predicted RNA-binding Zn-ribbon protein involved in translation (DUF1610 family)
MTELRLEDFIRALLDDEGTWHAHQCNDCGEVWEHEKDSSVSSEEYDRRHDCPQCGVNQRSKLRVDGRHNWPKPLGLSSKGERDDE